MFQLFSCIHVVAGFWWSGVDLGGVHTGSATQSSGLGHVCLCLLLCDDFYLDGGVRLWDTS